MMQTVMTLPIHVLKKLRHVLDSKLEIIVFHLNPKILNNKFSITDPSLLQFQFLEISLFIRMVFIKFILKIKDTAQNTQ